MGSLTPLHVVQVQAAFGLAMGIRFLCLGLVVFGVGACKQMPPTLRSVIVDGRVVPGVSEQVQRLRSGESISAAPCTRVEVGDQISTGSNAQAVLRLENGKVEVTLLENTKIEVRGSSIFTMIGEVFVSVAKNLRGEFKVESEYGVATPVTTEFRYSVGRDGSVRLVSLEGRVRVLSPSGAWQPLTVSTKEEVIVGPRAPPQQRKLGREEINSLFQRRNQLERVIRPPATQRLFVPDVRGLIKSEARRILKAQGLAVGEVTPRVTGQARVGEVLSQQPAWGQRVTPGNPVRLTVEGEPTPR